MNREKLKRIVLDIEATEKAIKDLSSHKRDVYADNAKEFEPKVLRKIIQRRRLDPDARKRDDDLLDQYESALGMTGKLAQEAAAGELTYDEAAKAADVSRRTMARHVARARAVPKATDDGTPHDAETGEITETADRKSPGDSSERDGEGSSSGEAVATFAAPETCVDGESVHLQAADSIVPRRTNPQTEGASTPSVTPVPEEGEGTGTIEPGRALDAAESERPAPAPIAEPIDWDAINATHPRELVGSA